MSCRRIILRGKVSMERIASISQYITNPSTACSELQLSRCQQLDTVEFSFCWKSHATEMLPHLEMFMDKLAMWQLMGSLDDTRRATANVSAKGNGKEPDDRDWMQIFCEDVVERL